MQLTSGARAIRIRAALPTFFEIIMQKLPSSPLFNQIGEGGVQRNGGLKIG